MKLFLAAAAVCALFVASSPVMAGQKIETTRTMSGSASWYGGKFHGRLTANGERYNMNALTAAHRTLGFGTRVRVTNPATGKAVVVRINDRGPFVGNRVIDLSRAAANAIGMIGAGVARVQLQVVR